MGTTFRRSSPRRATTEDSGTGAPDADRRRATTLPLVLGVVATVLTATGVSGIGDAPDPKAPAADIAGYLQGVRDDVLAAAPFGYLGAIALVLLVLHLASRLRREGQAAAAVAVTVGGSLCAAYLAGVQVVYTTLVYEVAATSPDTTKALFVGTILAAPLLGAGLTALLGGLAWGDRSARLVPRWLVVASAVGAVVASLALVSFGQRDLFSPDVQQQITGNIVVPLPLVLGAALAWRARRR